MANTPDRHKAILVAAFAKVDSVASAVALGSVLGLLLFIATAVLLVDGMLTGAEPGPHLGLLGIYLPGYVVSWPGAMLGAAYMWAIGAIAGYILAVLWNLTHHLYIAVMVVRTIWWEMAG